MKYICLPCLFTYPFLCTMKRQLCKDMSCCRLFSTPRNNRCSDNDCIAITMRTRVLSQAISKLISSESGYLSRGFRTSTPAIMAPIKVGCNVFRSGMVRKWNLRSVIYGYIHFLVTSWPSSFRQWSVAIVHLAWNLGHNCYAEAMFNWISSKKENANNMFLHLNGRAFEAGKKYKLSNDEEIADFLVSAMGSQ